ncbi:hypothetical protein [Allochromatium vinosum]|uniref:Uncharacterized protein n=1 Tax=Allochromatium vinosum (strain ATCC 17899 / DSM 180 / NBRC 103801 / NCIMB 10441 / D) TaxID=572477 RepID=D3RSU0_ALLVD|nr:hypothetical protein [Allochromatium vinosum]ADC62249.1 conserved hypothetical protein [Allochromatium vinosum DSM 180]MBK1653533.1 hypothetical protein [Allochromatium vinosum]
MHTEIVGTCWYRGAGLDQSDYGRETCCMACGKPTRVCRNCRHHASGRPNDCLKPLAERVLDKTRANFCEHFESSLTPAAAGTSPAPEDLARAAQDLFK